MIHGYVYMQCQEFWLRYCMSIYNDTEIRESNKTIAIVYQISLTIKIIYNIM